MPPFKAAVLVNSNTPLDPLFKHAFLSHITTASPHAHVDFFDPIHAQIYPSPGVYDLIVLSGGTADATAVDIPWILRLHEFLRTTVETCPAQKFVGICWGHQAVQVAFGGSVGGMQDGGFEVGVTSVVLTARGVDFFSSDSSLVATRGLDLEMHQFHEREVRVPGEGFVALAEGNQCLLNEANTILTFQGHPEMDAGLSRRLLEEAPKYAGGNEAERQALEDRVESPHDGSLVWKRIIEWAGEV